MDFLASHRYCHVYLHEHNIQVSGEYNLIYIYVTKIQGGILSAALPGLQANVCPVSFLSVLLMWIFGSKCN